MSVPSTVRTQLARRAPRVEQALVRARWRARNRGRAFLAPPPRNPQLRRLYSELRRNGIAIGRFEELVGERELFEEAAAEAFRLADLHRQEMRDPERRKPFLLRVHPEPFESNDPFSRIALHPNVLAVVNRYLHMRSFLLALDVWLTVPTEGPATETQLWHRDTDDMMVAKLFLYFSPVTEPSGPFCYAPRTHPVGNRREQAEMNAEARTTDEQMRKIVPSSDWVICTGEPGTVILADTCGYHKQLKPSAGERLLMIAEYTSGTPFWPRSMELRCADTASLSLSQRRAVFRDA